MFGEERHRRYPKEPTAVEQGFSVAPTSFGGLFRPFRNAGCDRGHVGRFVCKGGEGRSLRFRRRTYGPNGKIISPIATRSGRIARSNSLNEKKKLLDALGQSLKE